MLSIALAVLVALLPAPSPDSARRSGSAFSATTSDQCTLIGSHRIGEPRRELRGGGGPEPLALPSEAARPACVARAAAPAFAAVRAEAPRRRPATVRARAPPLA